ncbi:MAG: twin-arginine translocase TatA/TatE family subunit [Gammaproteobacteria bacterium]|nr:twin-arginine translocase TatA/TatE family subunit [Gammaproteobacteria bacterium]MDH3767432.1 twin-arginine translocase TatA/TatE family subunit [Gammaproteobacteria bacterium]
MGLGGISIWQLLIVLLIVVLVFGTRRLKGLGTDLGGALRSFRKAINEADSEPHSQLTDDGSKSSESVQGARDRVDS